jgi:hypothetical protein
MLFHIRSGSYGDTKLDGLDFITALSWPKAIHEGNGTAQLFVRNKANEEQKTGTDKHRFRPSIDKNVIFLI